MFGCLFDYLFTPTRNRLNKSIVQGERRDDSLITLAAFLELFQVEATILILIHHAENLADALLGGIFVLGQLDHGADLERRRR